MRNLIAGLLLACLMTAGCTTLSATSSPLVGSPPVCSGDNAIGRTIILPLTHWRADQKDVPSREAYAVEAIRAQASALTCASSVEVASIGPDTGAPERIEAARTSGFDSAIAITVRELGPQIELSFPVLVRGASDVDFNVRVVSLADNSTLLHFDQRRRVTSDFQLRRAGLVERQFELALQGAFGGPTSQ